MLKYLLWSLAAFIVFTPLSGQADIEIDVKHYESDTLILGYYLADKLLIKDSLFRNDGSETFKYAQDSLMEPGMYVLVSVPEGMFYQILVGGPDDQAFKVTIDTIGTQEVTIEGSEENTIFYDYLEYTTAARKEQARLDQVLMDTDSVMQSIRLQLMQDKLAITNMVAARQQKLIADHPESIAAILVKSNESFEFPEFTGTADEIQTQKYRYYKERYFENIDFNHPAVLRTPVIHQRVNYYMENLTPLEPDSTIVSVDRLLGMMDADSEAYRYYLSYFLNKYGNSKYIGFDAVYVHLALNYYGKDKATDENKKEIVENALKIKPILIGKTAPEFTIYKQDGAEVSLSDFSKDYTVLVFWKPGCGHCTKAMPHVLDFHEKYKDKGVDVLAICTKQGKDFDTCWEDIEKKNMTPLINAADQYGKSRILSKYYATSTPKIFILDGDKKIKLKKVPAENLDAVMQQLMRIDAEEAGTGE